MRIFANKSFVIFLYLGEIVGNTGYFLLQICNYWSRFYKIFPRHDIFSEMKCQKVVPIINEQKKYEFGALNLLNEKISHVSKKKVPNS